MDTVLIPTVLTGKLCEALTVVLLVFRCICKAGFEITFDSMGSERCDDIDECAQGACGSETCYNTQGDYK